MSRVPNLITAAALLLVLAACDRFPRDPERSLDSALEAGVLDVGLLHAPPWVDTHSAAEPAGIEVRLLEDFAASLDLDIQWRMGGMEELFEALERRELDFVAGGLTDTNPWKSKVGFTQPWFVTVAQRRFLDKRYRHVFAAPRGENALIMRLESFLLEEIGREEMLRRAREAGVP